jgi:single-stranded DNA-binding protein
MIQIQGELEFAPELRFTPMGKAVCTFSVIEVNSALIIRCEAWESLAEKIIELDLKARAEVTVRGYEKTRDFKGSKRAYFVVNSLSY